MEHDPATTADDAQAVTELGEIVERQRAVDRARDGHGPTLLECQTYRHYGHSKGDPGAYRPQAEVDGWLSRDPLKIARARLLEEGVSEQQIAAAEQSISELMEGAVETARAA